MRRCKVIATFLGPRSVRKTAAYPYHEQNIADVRGMLADVVAAESSDAQLIVVVNGNEMIDLGNGVIVEYRENVGGSFGAYDHAFQKYREQFDWWFFTEDDIVIGPRGYYDKFVEAFDKTVNCGMVAAVGVRDRPPQHAHGGVGLSHRIVLDKVCAANRGYLPHPTIDGWRRRDIELEGEVSFTNLMVDLGYRLVPFGNNREWNWQKNLCLPYAEWVNAGRPG